MQRQGTVSPSSNADLREDVSLFSFRVVLASDKKPEEAERALLDEIRRLQEQPLKAAELEKARSQLVTSQLHERETGAGKAHELGYAAVVLGDPDRVNVNIERLQRVTAADVQQVMKKYFSESNRVVIHYLPETVKEADAPNR